MNAWLGQLVPWAHRGHLTTCLWMVMALLQRGEVSLTWWLPYIPCRGLQAQSKQRRLSRWLHHSRLNVHCLYKPLIQAALADWDEDCLYLSLDTSLFWIESSSKYTHTAMLLISFVSQPEYQHKHHCLIDLVK